jgi:transposase
VECDPIRVCELLVGLPDVNVLGVDDEPGGPIRVHVECRGQRPCCGGCGSPVWVKDRPRVELVDLPAFGRPARLVWHKHRWWCPNPKCDTGSWTGENPLIAGARLKVTDRAGRWVTVQVGRLGRTVSEVARELGCDWHTVNDTVIAYGAALVDDDPDRIGEVTALGLDETLFCRKGRWRSQRWATSIVDVSAKGGGYLLDVVPGRNATGASTWLAARPAPWREQVRFGVLDLSGPYRKTFDDTLGHVVQVADPFHLIRLANSKLDEGRRRVQNHTLGHRGPQRRPVVSGPAPVDQGP